MESQGSLLEELARRVAALEGTEQQVGDTETVATGDDQDQDQDWRPPRRRPGMPDAGVVTLEEQPDEAHAFGPAPPLVAEWRQLQAGGDQVVSRVDRARSLAGNPLAKFRATPSRRMPSLYSMIVYEIRCENPLLHRQSTLRKRRLGENRGSRPHFLGQRCAGGSWRRRCWASST